MITKLSMLGAAVAVLTAGPALAQAHPSADQVAARAQRSADALDGEIRCLEDVHTRLAGVVQLVADARHQAQTASSDSVRRDAVRTVESLSQRIDTLEQDAQACRTAVPHDSQAAARTRGGQGVVYVDAPPDPTAQAVATPNAATEVIEHGTTLTSNVHVRSGERVDGMGHVEPAAIRAAVAGIGGRLDRCYEHLVGQGVLRTGTAILVFTVTTGGRVTGVHVEEDSLHSTYFDACLRHAGEHLRSSAAASGGNVVYSYTLAFGSS